MTITTEWNPTEADHIAAARLIFRRSLRRWRPWRGVLIVSAVLGCIGVLITWGEDNLNERIGVICALGVWGLVCVPICWGLNYLLLPRRVRRLLQQERVNSGPWRWEWSAESLRNDSANAQVRLAWQDLVGWTCGEKSLLFYLSEVKVLFVSRQVLDEGEVEQIGLWAAANDVPRW